MIKKKICMLGAFATGKTSLVQQYVHRIFSEKYHTTVGVKIDKKPIVAKGKSIDLIVWDLHGKDEFQDVRMSYLKGCSGCIYVVDGTRKATLDVTLELRHTAEQTFGPLPFVLVINKMDIRPSWEIDSTTIERLGQDGIITIKTSAKTGQRVEEAFLTLAEMMVDIDA